MFGLTYLPTIILVTSLLNSATAKVLYITPSTSELCTTQCLTISELAANTSSYISSNTTLVFTAGTHHLTADLTVSDVNNVSITSNSSYTAIVCMHHSYIKLNHSQFIHISNMDFSGYGGINVQNVEEFVLLNAVFDGQDKTETSLSLFESTANIINCSVIYNFKDVVYWKWMQRDGFKLVDGLVVVIDSNISFSHCQFDNNEVMISSHYSDDDTSVMLLMNSWVAIDSSTFVNNIAVESYRYGVNTYVIHQERGHVDISNSYFYNNSVDSYSVFKSTSGSLNVTNSSFSGNRGTYPSGKDKIFGGMFILFYSNIFARNNSFDNNNADFGGVLYSEESSVTFETCSFDYNHVYVDNGVGLLSASNSNITVKECNFTRNTAWRGAVIKVSNSFMIIEIGLFDSNHAKAEGGVLNTGGSHIIVKDCSFTHNTAQKGAVIYATSTLLTMTSSVVIANNVATEYATVYLGECEVNIWGDYVFSNNTGSFVAYRAHVSFMGYSNFLNNQINAQDGNILKGGAITLFLSVMRFAGSCNVSYTHAENGGAIRSSESKVYVNGHLTVTHNSANESGGGIYLYNSEMNCSDCSLQLSHNTAKSRGGGIHAIASTIKFSSVHSIVKVVFINNTAEKGGGLSMESNSKLYMLAGDLFSPIQVCYIENTADYGAAMFVDDDTYTSTCSRKLKGECFFQVLERYYVYKATRKYLQFSQNTARYSGSTLYGGLLDRCAVSPFVELSPYSRLDSRIKTNGLVHFKSVTSSTNLSISSGPVKVCHCDNEEYDCELNYTLSKSVRKGEVFTVSVVAVDQVSRPVNATIQTSLTHSESGLAEGQLSREIRDKCTHLLFSITSTHHREELSLYASDGPCKDADSSKLTYYIKFLPCECPVGFQRSETSQSNCTCDCHRNISRYVTCDIHRESFVRKYASNVWISYDNSSGYLVYLNCPYDYCKPLNSTSVNLNQQNGADAQCAFNRSSLLCGSCEPGLSLSLGSSLCLSCPIHWPALLTSITIAAILAGIALVTLLLTLNMTVAVGTLNGLLLYVNILSANRSILLPFQEQNYITVLISWLNLELGIDTCYFEGMDTYAKTWIQLVFPFYIMFIVALVIIISSFSSKFSKVIGKKDPVATLATLILFSYATLLQVIFRVFSFGTLTYAEGTVKVVWLPDATVGYLDGKHIALFLVAVLILVIGLVYTILVFSWQLLLRLPDWKIFKWSRNPRLQTFIETYHTPYTARHRYWTGLLLLVRVVLHLVAAVNVSNSPQVALFSVSLTTGGLLFLGYCGRVYKKWPHDLLDSFFYFNLLLLSLVTWYSLGDSESNREAAAYTSVTITLIVLLIIILFHVYFHTSLFAKLHDKKFMTQINSFFRSHPPPSPRPQSPPPDEDAHRFHELLDIIDRPANTNDYELAQRQQSAKPTHSVVEIGQPLLQPHQERDSKFTS